MFARFAARKTPDSGSRFRFVCVCVCGGRQLLRSSFWPTRARVWSTPTDVDASSARLQLATIGTFSIQNAAREVRLGRNPQVRSRRYGRDSSSSGSEPIRSGAPGMMREGAGLAPHTSVGGTLRREEWCGTQKKRCVCGWGGGMWSGSFGVLFRDTPRTELGHPQQEC